MFGTLVILPSSSSSIALRMANLQAFGCLPDNPPHLRIDPGLFNRFTVVAILHARHRLSMDRESVQRRRV